jgi:hypothetical protein
MLTLAARVLNTRPDLGELTAPLGELARQATDPDPFQRPTAQDLLIALVSGVVPAATSPMVAAAGDMADQKATSDGSTRVDGPTAALQENGFTRVDGHTEAFQENVTAPPLKAPRKPRSRGRRRLLAAAAVVAALSTTAAVLVKAEGGTASRTGGVTAASTAGVTAAANVPAVGADIGRRMALGGYDAQVIVPTQPDCGLPSYGEAAATSGGLCVVPWTVVNLGGEKAAVDAVAPRLVDDQGAEHTADANSTALPTALAPGDRTDGVLIFDLPPKRRPVRLILADGVEVRL